MDTFENLIFIPEGSLIKNNHLVKDSRVFLANYHKQIKLICLAKTSQTEILPLMKKLQIAQYFNAIFFKEQLENNQPFRTIIKQLQLDPDSTLIIGSSLNDEIQEAAAENLKSLWIAPKRVKIPITPHPTLKLTRLSDLEFYLN